MDILYRALARRFGDFDVELPGLHDDIDGVRALTAARGARRSVPARPNLTRQRGHVHEGVGLRRARSSREGAGGRVAGSPRRTSRSTSRAVAANPANGEGFETVEMQFLADVRLICPVCRGKRFQGATCSPSSAPA